MTLPFLQAFSTATYVLTNYLSFLDLLYSYIRITLTATSLLVDSSIA